MSKIKFCRRRLDSASALRAHLSLRQVACRPVLYNIIVASLVNSVARAGRLRVLFLVEALCAPNATMEISAHGCKSDIVPYNISKDLLSLISQPTS